jgi:hypothetical protein
MYISQYLQKYFFFETQYSDMLVAGQAYGLGAGVEQSVQAKSGQVCVLLPRLVYSSHDHNLALVIEAKRTSPAVHPTLNS